VPIRWAARTEIITGRQGSLALRTLDVDSELVDVDDVGDAGAIVRRWRLAFPFRDRSADRALALRCLGKPASQMQAFQHDTVTDRLDTPQCRDLFHLPEDLP
jgi:hypothetical protein